MADRCNSSATSHVVWRWRWWRTASQPASHHRRHLFSVPLSRPPSLDSSSFPRLIFRSLFRLSRFFPFPSSSTLSSPSLSNVHPPQRLLKRYTVYTHRLNVSPTSLTPTLRYPSSSTLAPSTPYFPHRPVAGHPPIPSNPAYVILATVYYAHVLTERRTSDLRESPCNPLRAHHPPD